jgi:hypothetical protein
VETLARIDLLNLSTELWRTDMNTTTTDAAALYKALAHPLVGDVIPVQIGNAGDAGKYHGQVVNCKVLATRVLWDDDNAYLCEIIGDESYLCDVMSHGETWNCTNARVIDENRWPKWKCVESLGYKL